MSERLYTPRSLEVHNSPPKSPLVRAGTQSGGQSLDKRTQSEMAARFGHDFSQVRIHTDARAGESAQAMGANAFTVGTDIVFGEGQYAPGSSDGERLLAHELTHVVQQSQSGPGDTSRMSGRGDASEREAEALAGRATAGQSVQVSAAPGAALAREEQKSPWQSWDDNPLWNFITNDAVSGANGIEMTRYQDLHNAEAGKSIAQDAAMQRDFAARDYGESRGWAPNESGPMEEITGQKNLWAAEHDLEEASKLERYGAGGTAMQVERTLENTASTWSKPLKTAGNIGRFLSPLGMYSDGMSMVNDFRDGNYADATADTLGFVSSTIGTTELAGAGLTALGATGAGGALGSFAAAANPVGAVAGSAAGGYALGKYGLGKANDYAKNHEIFGKGDNGEARDSTGAASDAGMWVKDHLGGGTFGSIMGGIASVGSSWGTAAYSGVHALGSGIAGGAGWLWDHTFGGGTEVDMEAMNKAQAVMNENMDQQDRVEIDSELDSGMHYSQTAHEEMPPLPADMKSGHH